MIRLKPTWINKGVVNNKLLSYADDLAIVAADNGLSNIEKLLKNKVETVSDWLIDSKLSLHLGKSGSKLFRSEIKLKSWSNLNITCRGTDIEPRENVKYLVATLEQCLSGESMVKSIIQRLMLG